MCFAQKLGDPNARPFFRGARNIVENKLKRASDSGSQREMKGGSVRRSGAKTKSSSPLVTSDAQSPTTETLIGG